MKITVAFKFVLIYLFYYLRKTFIKNIFRKLMQYISSKKHFRLI